MISYTLIETSGDLEALTADLSNRGVNELAMDFEEESNLHVYGEHLCLIQLFDRTGFYIVDALKLQNSEDGKQALKTFFESPATKIMFDCSSDAAIVRKTLGIILKNIYDIRIPAQALGFNGNLTGLIERNLGIQSESPSEKKKWQKANWIRRPLPEAQLEYALLDVKYLFDLKESLIKEMAKLNCQERHKVDSLLRNCATPKHKDKPGWEKICNYKMLTRRQKVFIRSFFMARDALARKANVPPTNIVEKQTIVAMAKAETWAGLLSESQTRYSEQFEEARLKAIAELKSNEKA